MITKPVGGGGAASKAARANVEQMFSLGGGLVAQTRPPPKYKGTHLDPPLPPNAQVASPTRI